MISISIMLMASALWMSLLYVFLPEAAVNGGYLVIAIYMRFRLLRNSQIGHLIEYKNVPVLTPEVIDDVRSV